MSIIMKNKDGRGQALKLLKATEVSQRRTIVSDAIVELKKRPEKFNNITNLAKYLVEKIKEKYPEEKITESTLRRPNSKYKDLLDGYLKGNQKPQDEIARLQSSILELSNDKFELLSENQSLKKMLGKLQSDFQQAIQENKIQRIDGKDKLQTDTRPFAVIISVLEKALEDSYDITQEGIIDNTGMSTNQVFLSYDEYPEFFEWYKQNSKKRV